ncbi:XK-related protein 8-like [Acanthopagrus latus]|uniref:XK-related protein 8-like n=1 Tax=Acanthopagrus latus TaxID=8177 RepID=UPI00187CA6BC|nr:XK-related protein 8-like [Acanthopagrus latus]
MMSGTFHLFKLSWVDFLFTVAGLGLLVLDIVLDVYAVVSFYNEKAYVPLGFLLLFLVGSSVLVQAFSWLWYSYEDFKRETKVEKCLSLSQLRLFHVLQLGIYIRHAGVFEFSVRSFCSKLHTEEGVAVFLSHDLSMLRLVETFSESCPQLVLMLTIILQRNQLDFVTVLKAIGSALAIACSVTMYHRSLRSFLVDKENQQVTSSVVYFLWNLLLIAPRLTALALFASVLPCFILTHFICSWMMLFFFAWRSKTSFMDSAFGEWLYRATVGLIWYFDWFNVVDGKTRYQTLLYHGYILADISLLCGLYCWMKMSPEPPYLDTPLLNAIITAASVVGVYILGLFLKVIYYKCCHPNLVQLKGDTPTDEVDFPLRSSSEGHSPVAMTRTFAIAEPDIMHCNKRMKKLAENFYS